MIANHAQAEPPAFSEAWFRQRHSDIHGYCRARFLGRGAMSLNAHAFGWDLIKAPINVAFAPIWLLLHCLVRLVAPHTESRWIQAIRDCPPGLRTQVQAELSRDLLNHWLRLTGHSMPAEHWRSLDSALNTYLAVRQASSEILINLMVLLLGALLFGSLTTGGLSFGAEAAQQWEWHQAVDSFWGGPWLGAIWYGWFPPDVPLPVLMLAISISLAAMAAASALSGFLLDPLEQILGWHQKRLQNWLSALEDSLDGGTSYQGKEPWLARLGDATDWIRQLV